MTNAHNCCVLSLCFQDLQMPVMDGWEATQQVRMWEANGGHQGAYRRASTSVQSVDQLAAHPQQNTFSRSQTSPTLNLLRTTADSEPPAIAAPTQTPLAMPSSPISIPPVSGLHQNAAFAPLAVHQPGLGEGSLLAPLSEDCEVQLQPQLQPGQRPVGLLGLCTSVQQPSSPHMLFNGREPCQGNYLLNELHTPLLNQQIEETAVSSHSRGTQTASGVHSLPSGSMASSGSWRQGGSQLLPLGLPDSGGPVVGAMRADDVAIPKGPVKRIPIVACTAELLESPLGWALGANGAGSGVPTGCNSGGLPASPGATAASHALSCGVDECVRKPLSYPMLCDILQRHIPEWAGPSTRPAAVTAAPSILAARSAHSPVPRPAPTQQPGNALQAYVRSRTVDESTSQGQSAWAEGETHTHAYGRSISDSADVRASSPALPERDSGRPLTHCHGLRCTLYIIAHSPPDTLQHCYCRLAENHAMCLCVCACLADAVVGHASVVETAAQSTDVSQALSFHAPLVRSTCATPCLEVHEPDMNDHLMEVRWRTDTHTHTHTHTQRECVFEREREREREREHTHMCTFAHKLVLVVLVRGKCSCCAFGLSCPQLLPFAFGDHDTSAAARNAYVRSASAIGSWGEPPYASPHPCASSPHMSTGPHLPAVPSAPPATPTARDAVAAAAAASSPSAAAAPAAGAPLSPTLRGVESDDEHYVVQSLCAWSEDDYIQLKGATRLLQASQHKDDSTHT